MEIAVLSCVWIKQIDSSSQVQNERWSLQVTLMGEAVVGMADDCGLNLRVLAEFFEPGLNRPSLAAFGVNCQLNVRLRLLEKVHPEREILVEVLAELSSGHTVVDFKFSFDEQESGKMFGEEVSRLNGSFRQR